MELKLSRYLIGVSCGRLYRMTITRQALRCFQQIETFGNSHPPSVNEDEQETSPSKQMIPRLFTFLLQLRGKATGWAGRRNGGYIGSMRFQMPKGLCLVLLLMCGDRTNAQVYFDYCFSNLEQADVDLNGELTAEEYSSFVVAYTDGALELPLPPVVLEPFQVLSSTTGGVVPIAGVKATDQSSQVTVIQLCHQVKIALMSHYEVATEWDRCIGALKAGDQAQPAGFLGPEQEFAAFIASFSLGSVSSVTPLAKVAHDDMAVDGMIAGPQGGEYLMEFCQRVDLALSIEASKPITPTLAPTASSTDVSSREAPTLAPTLAPSTRQSEVKEVFKVHVAQTNALPQVQFELTEPVFQKCQKDLLLTDINRNDLFERKEYARFVNRLHNEVFQSDIHDDAVDATDRAYLDILADQGKRVVPGIYGVKPGQSPSRTEEKMLRFVCQTSHEMIRNVHKGDSDLDVADDIDRDSGSSEDDFNKFYRTCKISLFVSDRNRDSKVDQDEFATMISRISLAAGDKFRELDDVFQKGFRHASTGGAIKISGSSPAVQPTLMEVSHLQFVCQDIKKSIDDFDKKQAEMAASDNLQVRNNNLEDQFPDLSEEFFRTCTMGMFIADEDRDSRLSSPEFFDLIDRLSFGDLDANSYADLHPVFKASFNTFSDDDEDGFVDIVGSKPGVSPNYDEEIALRKICSLLNGAILDVREEILEKEEAEAEADLSKEILVTAPPVSSDGPIEDDTDEDQTSEEKREPEDKEGKPQPNDQQKGEKQNGKQEKGQKEKGKKEPNTVNVISQGNAKTEQTKQNTQSKTKTTKATGVSDTIKSLKNPDPSAPPEMSYTMFTKCKKKLAQADGDDDRTLDPEEYFSFASALTSTIITSKSFDRLSETVAAPFHEFAVGGQYVPILGAGIRQEPSALEIERLQSFCGATFAALHYYENPVSDEQDCISSMFSGDDDLDTWLNEQEYVGFLNAWSKQRYQSYEFSGLPYVLQANYKWSKSFNGFLSVAARKLTDIKRFDIQRLESICDRLASTVSDRSPSMTVSDHCRKSIVSADIDRDGFIEKREFISLISVFTDRLWKPAKRFKAIHPILRLFFETTVNLDDKLDVQSASTGGDALDTFCASFEEAVDEAQEKQSRLDRCQQSLFLADADGDMRLSSTEYVDMLYGLIIYPGLLDEKPTGLTFDDLHVDVQATFRSASSMSGDVKLDGFFAPDISEAAKEQLQLLCNEIFDTAVPQVGNEEISIYSSFLMAGVNNTLASDYSRRMVNKAYQSFVSSGMQTGAVADNRRKLAVLGPTPHSAKVYDVFETECPTSYEQNATCQTFFASYQAITLGENDRMSTANDLGAVAQDAIDDGALQKEMISLDPELPLKVLRASFPVTPSESVALAIKRAKGASVIMRTGNIMILSLSGVFAFLFLCIGLFYGRRLKKREELDVANTKLPSENLALLGQYQAEDDNSSSDDEDMDGMTKEEKRKIRRERRLRQSIIPLLLGQAYVSSNPAIWTSNFLTHCWFPQHLPDYTYGEDLFQYTYNRHPVLGLLWRHSLHPIGFNVRFVCLVGSIFVGFAVSNIIYITFLAFGWDFDSNYFAIAAETIAITGKDSFDNEIMAAAATFTNGNVAIWTIGSTLHAIFDSSLWSMAACTCLAQDGFVEKIDRYSRLGSLAVSTYVVGIAVIAFASAAVRLVWASENDSVDEPSVELTPSLHFVMSMSVEAVIAYFFFYPLFAFTMFSGLLNFLDEDFFGGRRFEMLLVEKREKRELRVKQRKKLLNERENPPELQPTMSRDEYLIHRYPKQGQGPPDPYFYDVQSDYDDDEMLTHVQPSCVSPEFPSYLESSETEEDSSTCREMDFKPRTKGRRHSFGAESLSEREPVRRNWKDDHDTGSVVSAWSKSSWKKYGYDDWGDPEYSSRRRASGLGNLPDSVLAMVNGQDSRQSMREESSSEESEEPDSSWSDSSSTVAKRKSIYSKSKRKGSKGGQNPKKSSRRDLVSSASSSTSSERSGRSSSSNKDRARRVSRKQLKKSIFSESESSDSHDEVSRDSSNKGRLLSSVSVDSSSQTHGDDTAPSEATESSNGASDDDENRTSCPQKRRIMKEEKIRDDNSSTSSEYSISNDKKRIEKEEKIRDDNSSTSSGYSISKDDDKSSCTGDNLSDEGSDGISEDHRKAEKKVLKNPDASESSVDSSSQSRQSFQGNRNKTKSVAAESKSLKMKLREPEGEESDNSAADESYSPKDRNQKDGESSKKKGSAPNKGGSAEDDDVSNESSDATSKDRQQAKRASKKRIKVERANDSSESSRHSARDSRDKKRRASSRKKSSVKERREPRVYRVTKKDGDERKGDSSKKQRRGSHHSRVKSTRKKLASSDEGSYAIDDSPLNSSRSQSSWIIDSSDESSSLSSVIESRKSIQKSTRGSDKRRQSAHFGASDNFAQRSSKAKGHSSPANGSPKMRRPSSSSLGRQSSFVPQRYEQQFSGRGGGGGQQHLRRKSHGSLSSNSSAPLINRRMSAFATPGRRMPPGPAMAMGNRRMSDFGGRGRMQSQQRGRVQPGQRRMSGLMTPGNPGRGFQQGRGMQQLGGSQRRMSTMQQPQARQGPGMPQTPRRMSTMQQTQGQQGMPQTPRRMSTMQQQGRGMPRTPQRTSPMMQQQQGVTNMMQRQQGPGLQPGQRRMSGMPSPQCGPNNNTMMQQGRGMPQQGRGSQRRMSGMPSPQYGPNNNTMKQQGRGMPQQGGGSQRRMSAMQPPSNMMQGQRRMSSFTPQSPMMHQPGGTRRMSSFMQGNLQGGRGIPNRPGMAQQNNPMRGGGTGGRMPAPGGQRRMSAMGPTGQGGMYPQNNNNLNRRMSTGFVGNGMAPPGRGVGNGMMPPGRGVGNGMMPPGRGVGNGMLPPGRGRPQQNRAQFGNNNAMMGGLQQGKNNPGRQQVRNPY